MFGSRKRRQQRVTRFLDLLVADAFEAPSTALAYKSRPTRLLAIHERTATVRRSDGTVVCERCLVADSAFTRMRGLLGRQTLHGDEGVLLRPAGSIHTAFMRFAIDVVFLDRDGRVLRIVEHVRPWRTAAARRARSALELRAGESARRGVAVGDVLEVVR